MFSSGIGFSKTNLMESPQMTDDMMSVRNLVETSADVGLLCEMIGFAAESLMALEVRGKACAGYGERVYCCSPCATATVIQDRCRARMKV